MGHFRHADRTELSGSRLPLGNKDMSPAQLGGDRFGLRRFFGIGIS